MTVNELRFNMVKDLLTQMSVESLSKVLTVLSKRDIEKIDDAEDYEEYLYNQNSSRDIEAILEQLAEMHDKIHHIIDLLLDDLDDVSIIWEK